MIGIEYINIPTKNCNSYSEETSLLVLSLLEQIKAKDAQLHSQDEQIAALETKLVHIYLLTNSYDDTITPTKNVISGYNGFASDSVLWFQPTAFGLHSADHQTRIFYINYIIHVR